MKECSIGFRLNFNKVKSIEEVLMKYLERFDRYEIKITSELITANKLKPILQFSEKNAYKNYSLHLPKNLLVSLDEEKVALKSIEEMSTIKLNKDVYVITHIPDIPVKDYLDKLKEFLSNLPEHCILLLENKMVREHNLEYLNRISELFYILDCININNVKFCLDIGHLLYGFENENISQKEVFLLLEKTCLLNQIYEIHIHDYNEKKTHLQLGYGKLDFGILKLFLQKNNFKVPIIMEVTIINPQVDGVAQVNLLQKIINDEV